MTPNQALWLFKDAIAAWTDDSAPSGVWGFLSARLLSFTMILGVAFLLMVSLVISAGPAAIGKILIGLYLGKSHVASGFGAAGSLVLFMVWVYYSAQIFLIGAEFTWVYAHKFGSRKGVDPQPVRTTSTA